MLLTAVFVSCVVLDLPDGGASVLETDTPKHTHHAHKKHHAQKTAHHAHAKIAQTAPHPADAVQAKPAAEPAPEPAPPAADMTQTAKDAASNEDNERKLDSMIGSIEKKQTTGQWVDDSQNLDPDKSTPGQDQTLDDAVPNFAKAAVDGKFKKAFEGFDNGLMDSIDHIDEDQKDSMFNLVKSIKEGDEKMVDARKKTEAIKPDFDQITHAGRPQKPAAHKQTGHHAAHKKRKPVSSLVQAGARAEPMDPVELKLQELNAKMHAQTVAFENAARHDALVEEGKATSFVQAQGGKGPGLRTRRPRSGRARPPARPGDIEPDNQLDDDDNDPLDDESRDGAPPDNEKGPVAFNGEDNPPASRAPREADNVPAQVEEAEERDIKNLDQTAVEAGDADNDADPDPDAVDAELDNTGEELDRQKEDGDGGALNDDPLPEAPVRTPVGSAREMDDSGVRRRLDDDDDSLLQTGDVSGSFAKIEAKLQGFQAKISANTAKIAQARARPASLAELRRGDDDEELPDEGGSEDSPDDEDAGLRSSDGEEDGPSDDDGPRGGDDFDNGGDEAEMSSGPSDDDGPSDDGPSDGVAAAEGDSDGDGPSEDHYQVEGDQQLGGDQEGGDQEGGFGGDDFGSDMPAEMAQAGVAEDMAGAMGGDMAGAMGGDDGFVQLSERDGPSDPSANATGANATGASPTPEPGSDEPDTFEDAMARARHDADNVQRVIAGDGKQASLLQKAEPDEFVAAVAKIKALEAKMKQRQVEEEKQFGVPKRAGETYRTSFIEQAELDGHKAKQAKRDQESTDQWAALNARFDKLDEALKQGKAAWGQSDAAASLAEIRAQEAKYSRLQAQLPAEPATSLLQQRAGSAGTEDTTELLNFEKRMADEYAALPAKPSLLETKAANFFGYGPTKEEIADRVAELKGFQSPDGAPNPSSLALSPEEQLRKEMRDATYSPP